tara:strand:- start:255 stop:488 length:234 start_codon:yes stop_codon:yes gene_type:complete
MLKLNSVGSILDTKTGMVYPQNNDGTPDLNCGTDIFECCEEWTNSLDKKDLHSVYVFMFGEEFMDSDDKGAKKTYNN